MPLDQMSGMGVGVGVGGAFTNSPQTGVGTTHPVNTMGLHFLRPQENPVL